MHVFGNANILIPDSKTQVILLLCTMDNIQGESASLLADNYTGNNNNNDSNNKDNNKNKTNARNCFNNILQTFTGIASALLWVSTTVTSAVCVQLLERHIPDFELNMFRHAVPLICSLVIITIRAERPAVSRSEIPGFLAYAILGIVCSLTMYTAMSFMPVSTVQCVLLTAELFSGFILFSVFGAEKARLTTLLCLLICVTGIAMIIQPGFAFHVALPPKLDFNGSTLYNNSGTFLFEQHLNQTFLGKETNPSESFGIKELYILSIITGIGISLDVLILQRNTFLTENKLITLFWTFCTGTLVSAAMMVVLEHPVLPGSWYQVFLVMGHSIGYAFLWVFYLFAVQYISGNTLNMIVCICPVVMLIPQYTVLSSLYPGHKNWIEVVGVVLVLIGSMSGYAVEVCESKTKQET